MDSPLVVVVVLFACSLAGAYVLFKILQSSALITRKEAQIGGAAAGFLLIFAALGTYYSKIQNADLATCQASLNSVNSQFKDVSIQGTVDPAFQNASVYVITDLDKEPVTVDSTGGFRMTIKGNPYFIHVVSQTKTYDSYFFPGDDPLKIVIPHP